MFGKTKTDNINSDAVYSNPYQLPNAEELLHPRLTAEEAYRKSQVGRLAADAKTIDDAFKKIEKAANKGETSCVFFEGDTDIALLSNELPEYGYKTEQKTYGMECALQVSWDEGSQEASDGSEDESEPDNTEIDPDKKYILPIEKTKGNLGQLLAIKLLDDTWSVNLILSEDSISSHMTVTAKDLKDAPDWVKAIKPVEAKDA